MAAEPEGRLGVSMGKYAIMLNASTDDVGPMANGLEYALDLDETGHEVAVYLDGVATQWPGQLAEMPDHPVNDYFDEATERGLVAGACGFCAHAFDGIEGVEAAGIPVLGDAERHGPHLGEVVGDGFDVLTIG